MRCPLLCVLLVTAACGDLEVRSVRTPTVVPQQLVGEWVGTWQSAAAATGSIVVRVQEFAGAPVVRVDFANPCIEPRTYTLVITETTFELRSDQEVVMSATLAGREMVGSYHCPAETGTWRATWQRELPEVIDVGGTWAGSLAAAGQPIRPFELQLTQRVDGGELVLEGLTWFHDAWPVPLPIAGRVWFRDGGFDLLLRTPLGASPGVILTGTGSSTAMRIEPGLVQSIGTPVLPFAAATFSVLLEP